MTPRFGAHIDYLPKETVTLLQKDSLCSVVQSSFGLLDPLKPYGALVVPDSVAEISSGLGLDLFIHGPVTVNLATDTHFMAASAQRLTTDCLSLGDTIDCKGVVIHCGSWKTGSWEEGLERLKHRIVKVLAPGNMFKTPLLIENTAGKGTTMGSDIVQYCKVMLALRELVGDRVGVVLDLAHSWGAGYGPMETLGMLEAAGLFPSIKLCHFNGADPDVKQGSGRDRHRCAFDDCAQGVDEMREAFLKLSAAGIPMVVERGEDNVREVTAGSVDGVLLNDLRMMRAWSNTLPVN